MKTLAAAFAAFGLVAAVAAPAFAAPAFADETPARETISLNVSTQGLNLADPADRDALRTRVARAIAQACNPGDRIGADMKPDWQCRHEMAASAEPALSRR